MANQMDSRFAARRNYTVAGRGFTARLAATAVGSWHVVLRSADGKVAGINFADEQSALSYCRQKNNGQKLQYVASPDAPTPAFDPNARVAEARDAMLAADQGRKNDPRLAVATPEARFSYTAEQLALANENILEGWLQSRVGQFVDNGYNVATLSRALDDYATENPGTILTPALIDGIANQLSAANMLVTNKRGETVAPYRRLSEVNAAVAQQNKVDEDTEARRRRSLPLEEQRALLNEEGLQLQGSTANKSKSAVLKTETSSRSNAARAISDEEKDLRAKLYDGSVTFEDLKAQELQRRAEVARSKR